MDKARVFAKRMITTLASLCDDESDYFRPLDYFLVVGGIHLPVKEPLYRRLFLCYRVLLAVQFSVWIDRVYEALFKWNSRGDLIGVSSFFVGLVMILLRVGLIRLHLKKIQVVRQYFSLQLNEHRTGRRDRSYRLLRLIAVLLEFIFVVDQIMFYVFGIHRDRQYKVPDNLSQLDWRVKLFFDVVIASNHFVFSSVYVSILTVLNSLLMAFQISLEEIVLQVEGIFQRVDHQQIDAINKHEPMLKKHPKFHEALNELLFWRIFKEELNLVISRHSELLEQLETLGDFFKMTFLLMFYMEIVILGSAAFYIRMLGLTMNTFIVASYAGANLLECYWFCRLADILNGANNQIGHAFYDLNWHQRLRRTPNSAREYREIRATLLVAMAKAQHNLGISCGGMFEMSAKAFNELVNMIYSFLMFLVNTAND